MARHDHHRTSTSNHRTASTFPRHETFRGEGGRAIRAEQVLSWVSHELKTPISAATNAVHLASRALRAGDALDVHKRLDMVARQLRRMDELVTSILDAAQLDHGEVHLRNEDVPLGEVLSEVVSSWREMHPDHEFDVAADGQPHVRGDRERIRQILDNLVSNAVKYGGAARPVALSVSADASTISVSVRDHGSGIAPEERERLFDPFHRVPGQGGDGHGLGLYIAAALARLHGGALSLESRPGAGSTFTLTLPRRT